MHIFVGGAQFLGGGGVEKNLKSSQKIRPCSGAQFPSFPVTRVRTTSSV